MGCDVAEKRLSSGETSRRLPKDEDRNTNVINALVTRDFASTRLRHSHRASSNSSTKAGMGMISNERIFLSQNMGKRLLKMMKQELTQGMR
jgi:hypothetical protein